MPTEVPDHDRRDIALRMADERAAQLTQELDIAIRVSLGMGDDVFVEMLKGTRAALQDTMEDVRDHLVWLTSQGKG